MELRELADRVEASETLAELSENLTALDQEIEAQIEAGEVRPDTRTDDFVDTSSLPVFGGEEPADTMGIFSWDAESVLYIGDGWTIQSRGEYWE